MYVLITYDVKTSDSGGARRLRRVAKLCVQYGQRVQNSVFECSFDAAQLETVKHALFNEIDAEKDSLRFYNLGKNGRGKVEHVGAKESYDPDGFLCI